MVRSVSVIAVALVAHMLISCEGAEPASETLIVRGDRLFLPVVVNGVETEALLDSAAELSLVDDDFAASAGLQLAGEETARGTGGSEQVRFAEGVDIEAVGATMRGRTVAVFDLGDISERLVGARVDVVLGRDLFDQGRLLIDIENNRIAFVDAEVEPVGVRIELKESRGVETMPIVIEGGGAIEADFDLGNGSEMLIGAGFAARGGLSAPERIVGEREGGGVGGAVTRKLVRLAEVEIAGVQFKDIEAAIDETESAPDANVGVRLLRQFVITVDFPQHALWLKSR